MAEHDDTGRFRSIEGGLLELRRESHEIVERLTDVERLLALQQEHNKGLDRAFGEIRELSHKVSEMSLAMARIRGMWLAASIFWALFGGVIISVSGWAITEVLAMRDTIARHDYIIIESIKNRRKSAAIEDD